MGVRSAVAGQRQSRPVEIVQRREFRVEDLHIGIQHHRHPAFGERWGAVQRIGRNGIKGPIQCAIVAVAHQRKVVIAAVPTLARHENFAVGLDCHAGAILAFRPDSSRELAVARKAGVQRPVAVVAHQGEVVVAAVPTCTPHENLAIGLDRHTGAIVVARSEIRRELAVARKAGIQGPIRVVAHQGEVVGAADITLSRHQNLAVGLDRHAVTIVAARPEIRREHAVARKAGVQRPIIVIPHQGNIEGAAVPAITCHQNLPVGLDRHASAVVVAHSEIRRELAVTRKAGVQRPVAVVAGQSEVVGAADITLARHQNLPVGLDRHAVAIVAARPEIRRELAVTRKAGIQGPIRVVAHQGKVVGAAVPAITRHQNLPVGLDRDALAVVVA